MDSVDLEVLRKSAQWQREGKRVLLVTVVRTWGSSPRPPGAMLAVREDGQVVGSVSGGCIEDDIVERSRREGPYITRPQAATYGVTAEDARKFGLPCGGTIQLVLEPADANSKIAELLGMIEQGRLVARKLDLESAKVTLAPAHATDGLLFDGRTLTTIHGPRYRMLVIGAGQLSKYLAQIAVGLDYQVTVCDPREEYTETWDVPGVSLVRTMPDDTVVDMKLDERCAVVALTHDPKLDDLALLEALKSPRVLRRCARFARQQRQAAQASRGIRSHAGADRTSARADRSVHRQPHAAGNRHFHPGRDHGDQERRRLARRSAGGGGQGEAGPVGRVRDQRSVGDVIHDVCAPNSAALRGSAPARRATPARSMSPATADRASNRCVPMSARDS